MEYDLLTVDMHSKKSDGEKTVKLVDNGEVLVSLMDAVFSLC